MTSQPASRAGPGTLGIGDRLRNAREARRLTLDAAAAQTRIRVVYLQALEDEDFTRLPGPIYAKGFLRAYADTLGLDPDELVAVYPQAFAAPPTSLVGRPAEIPIRPVAPPSRLRRVLIYAAVVVVLLAAVFGYIGYQGWQAFNAPVTVAPPPSAGTGSPFEESPITPVPRPVPAAPPPVTPAPAVEPSPPAPPAPAPAEVSLTIRAGGTTWVRITTDGRRVFEGILHRGESRTASGTEVTVRIGNTPVTVVELNGRRVRIPAGVRVWQQTFTARSPSP